MTIQQYFIIRTHKILDELEESGKKHIRSNKQMDQEWINMIRDANKRFEEKRKKQEQEKEQEHKKEIDKKIDKEINKETEHSVKTFNEMQQSTISIEETIKQRQKKMMEDIISKQNNDT